MTTCWILQDNTATPHTQVGVVQHFGSREEAAGHSRFWAPGTSPVMLPERCYLLACACDLEQCTSPAHDDDDGCANTMHGRDLDDAVVRAVASTWEEATPDRYGDPRLLCGSCC